MRIPATALEQQQIYQAIVVGCNMTDRQIAMINATLKVP